MDTWKDLTYWSSGEWQVVSERLDGLTKKHVLWCPGKRNLFSVFRRCPFNTVRVCIIGQDPYPNPTIATGTAFDIPADVQEKNYPPTLKNIFYEYQSDLHYPAPPNGSLINWCKRGVFLWNAIPSCEAMKPTSHHWPEWDLLTQEIVRKLDEKDVVFVFLGRHARAFIPEVTRHSKVLETSHPSPLGVNYGFAGSRIFSTVNSHLVNEGLDPIDWRL